MAQHHQVPSQALLYPGSHRRHAFEPRLLPTNAGIHRPADWLDVLILTTSMLIASLMPDFKRQKSQIDLCRYLAESTKLRAPPEGKVHTYKNCLTLNCSSIYLYHILKSYHHEAVPLKTRGFIMPGKSRLDRVYAQLMSEHPYGWALYKQVTTRDIHPGSCGYFDSEGDWNTITDLSSPQDLIGQGWTIPDEGIYDSNGPGSTTWGPKCSNSIQARCIGGTAIAT